MRAIDYGLQQFGGYSYKNSKSNIYAFNENTRLEDDTNELGSLDINNDFYFYVEIEFIDENKKSFNYVENGEVLSYETISYIKESGVSNWSETSIDIPNNENSYDQLNTLYTLVIQIDDKSYIQLSNQESDILGAEVVLAIKNSKKNKTNKPLFLLTDTLYENKMSVALFVSDDGAKLESAYQQITPFQNEVVLFIENNIGKNMFGSVVRVKIGDSISNTNAFPSQQVIKVIKAFKFNINISNNTLKEIIEDQIESNDGLLFFVKRTLGFISNVTSVPVNLALETIEIVFNQIALGIETLKLEENRWRYYNDDGTISTNANLLIPGIELFNNLANSAKTPKASVLHANAIKIIDELEIIVISKANEIAEIIPFFKGKFIRQFINSILKAIAQIKDFLRNPAILPEYLAKNMFIAYNAYIVGLINGIIEGVKGIFELISLIAKGLVNWSDLGKKVAANTSSYLGMFIELAENQLEAMLNLFSVENLKAILNFFKNTFILMLQLPSKAINWLLEDGTLINIDKIYYYIGYIIGVIIEMILEIMATLGAATFIKAAEILGEGFKNLFKGIVNLIKFVKKGACSFIDTFIAIFAYIREKAKNLKPLLDEFFEALKKWIDELGKNKNQFDEVLEISKIRKAAYVKWASKFEKRFHLHFDGEFMIRSKKGIQKLQGTGGHNHSVIGKNIRVRKYLTEPIDDLPFDALIEVRYKSSQWIEKQAKSTMFPENWDINRVKEEIALVYDKMIKSGVFDQIKTHKSPSFKSLDSSGKFEIKIEVDEIGNLTNAYPNI